MNPLPQRPFASNGRDGDGDNSFGNNNEAEFEVTNIEQDEAMIDDIWLLQNFQYNITAYHESFAKKNHLHYSKIKSTITEGTSQKLRSPIWCRKHI